MIPVLLENDAPTKYMEHEPGSVFASDTNTLPNKPKGPTLPSGRIICLRFGADFTPVGENMPEIQGGLYPGGENMPEIQGRLYPGGGKRA